MRTGKYSLMILLSILFIQNVYAEDEQYFVDYFQAYNDLRKTIVSEELTNKIRKDMGLQKAGLNANILPLKTYYSKEAWVGTLECYVVPSCRGYMLLTLRDWTLKTFEVNKFESHTNWVELYYSGVQLDGEEGSGTIQFNKTKTGWRLGTSCWAAVAFDDADNSCK